MYTWNFHKSQNHESFVKSRKINLDVIIRLSLRDIIPKEIKEAKSISEFKATIKRKQLEGCCCKLRIGPYRTKPFLF